MMTFGHLVIVQIVERVEKVGRSRMRKPYPGGGTVLSTGSTAGFGSRGTSVMPSRRDGIHSGFVHPREYHAPPEASPRLFTDRGRSGCGNVLFVIQMHAEPDTDRGT